MASEDHSGDVFHHVRDDTAFHFPFGYEVELPYVEWLPSLQSWLDGGPVMGLQITKFMVLQVVAAVLALLIFAPLAVKLRKGDPVRGRFWNFWETILVFIRDEVVRPTIGDHDAHPPRRRRQRSQHGHGPAG